GWENAMRNWATANWQNIIITIPYTKIHYWTRDGWPSQISITDRRNTKKPYTTSTRPSTSMGRTPYTGKRRPRSIWPLKIWTRPTLPSNKQWTWGTTNWILGRTGPRSFSGSEIWIPPYRS